MRSFVLAAVVILGTTIGSGGADIHLSNILPEDSLYVAFCVDGDGALSDWHSSRFDAYLIGRDHERQFKSHRWELWTRGGATPKREPVCSRVSDGNKPNTVKVENICGKCARFTVARTNADGSVNAKEINFKSKKGRVFRKPEGSVVTVYSEQDCPQ
jgi:hypothetical protein